MAGSDVRPPPWIAAVVSAMVLALGLWFAGWRLSTPAECVTISPSPWAWTADGVVPTAQPGCPVRATDTITAVRTDSAASDYTVTRGGLTRELSVGLDAPSPGDRLAEGWSTLLFVVALFALAAYGFARRWKDRAATALLLASTGLLSSTVAFLLELPARFALEGWPRWLYLGNVLAAYTVGWCGALAFAVHFPDSTPWLGGRHPRLRRLAVWTGPAVVVAAGAVIAWPGNDSVLGWLHWTIIVQSSVTVATVLLSGGIIAVKALRSGRADAVRRQQLIWVGGTALAALSLTVALWFGPQLITGTALLPSAWTGLPGLIVVAGLTVALLRFRLFDLQAVLRRTLTYSALTLCVVLLYLGVVGASTAAFNSTASTPVAVLGAVAVAIAVNPLRVLLQRLVNRLLYGDRHDPYAALTRLSGRLAATAGTHELLEAVAGDVAAAMRLPYVCIERRSHGQLRTTTYGQPPPDERDCYQIPLAYRGAAVGHLRVARRAADEDFTPAERRLMSDLARQVSAAAREVELYDDLQRSREELVGAREEERRMIRRTLHDDIGPTMSGLALRAETARQLLDRPTGRDGVLSALAAITTDAATAASQLRRLAYDLRPPALDDRGIEGALRDHAELMAPTVTTVDVVLPSDLPAATEVAAYRIAVGAMTNAAQHAAAQRCSVHLHHDGEWLCVEVTDDGTGLPQDFRAGVGITAMRERAAELGGQCRLEPGAGGGTTVRARLPMSGTR